MVGGNISNISIDCEAAVCRPSSPSSHEQHVRLLDREGRAFDELRLAPLEFILLRGAWSRGLRAHAGCAPDLDG